MALVVMLPVSRSHAREPGEDKDVVAAASAYARAQQAELTGKHAEAAELFELADRIAPTPEALRSATRSRLAAGELPAAAAHAEQLVRRYPDDESSRQLAERVLSEARPALTRVSVECSEPCTVVIDGLASALSAATSSTVYLTPGSHRVLLGFSGERDRELRVHGSAGEERTLRVNAPPLAPVEAAPAKPVLAPPADGTRVDRLPRRHTLAPAYFWTAVGLTAVSAGLTVWSTVDLYAARKDFEAKAAPTRAEFETGERKDLRTSILIGSTSALAVGTLVVGLFTRFGSSRPSASGSAALRADRQGAELRYTLAF